MKLYIQELSAPRLFLAVPEAQPLVLKSTPAPALYLEKAKYTKREGSPGSYRYTYAKEGGSKTHIPEQQMGFEFNENVSVDKLADAINKIPNANDKDFLTLSGELEQQGIAADTKQIGAAFDSGKVKPGDRPHITNMSADDVKDHIAFEIGNPSSETGRYPVQNTV